jgi:hypothetical protein
MTMPMTIATATATRMPVDVVHILQNVPEGSSVGKGD